MHIELDEKLKEDAKALREKLKEDAKALAAKMPKRRVKSQRVRIFVAGAMQVFFSTWRWEVEEVPQYFLENAFAWLLRCKEPWLQQATRASSLRPTEAAPHSGSPGSPWHYELVWASTAFSISWSWRATTFCAWPDTIRKPGKSPPVALCHLQQCYLAAT